MIYESLKDWKQYDFGPVWAEAMAWVDVHVGSLEVGSWEVGGCSMFVTEGMTRLLGEGRYECHRRMADVQIVLQGEEDLYNLPVHGMTPLDPFDEERDLGFFAEPARYSPVRLFPGIFALLLPRDAHMPSMAVGGAPAMVRKLVVKIPVERLTLA